MKRYYVGQWLYYNAELFRVAGNQYKRLERSGYGYILQIINDELMWIYNGVRPVLVHRDDII